MTKSYWTLQKIGWGILSAIPEVGEGDPACIKENYMHLGFLLVKKTTPPV